MRMIQASGMLTRMQFMVAVTKHTLWHHSPALDLLGSHAL